MESKFVPTMMVTWDDGRSFVWSGPGNLAGMLGEVVAWNFTWAVFHEVLRRQGVAMGYVTPPWHEGVMCEEYTGSMGGVAIKLCVARQAV